jgi:hypothetical protein
MGPIGGIIWASTDEGSLGSSGRTAPLKFNRDKCVAREVLI